MQERRNSTANTLELRLSCTKSSICINRQERLLSRIHWDLFCYIICFYIICLLYCLSATLFACYIICLLYYLSAISFACYIICLLYYLPAILFVCYIICLLYYLPAISFVCYIICLLYTILSACYIICLLYHLPAISFACYIICLLYHLPAILLSASIKFLCLHVCVNPAAVPNVCYHAESEHAEYNNKKQ